MSLGFVNAGGVAGGYDSLDKIIAGRKADELLKMKLAQQEFENRLGIRRADQADAQIGQGSRELDLRDEAQHAPAPPEKPIVVNGRLVTPSTGAVIGNYNDPAPPEKPLVVNGRLVMPSTGAVIGNYNDPAPPPKDEFGDWRKKYDYELAHPKNGASGADGGPSPYSQERETRTRQSVDELLTKVNGWNTGMGSLLSSIPSTDARNFAAELQTLKANIAFNELTQMREASKTGGALGQVSNQEEQMLSSALGALDPGQSSENVKAQLNKIKASLDRWSAARAMQGAHGAGLKVNASGLPGGTAGGPVTVNGFTFPNQAAADAFKKEAGIP